MPEITDDDVIEAAFGDLAPDRWRWCCDEDQIREFLARARYVTTSIQGQFVAYKDNPNAFAPDWPRRARAIQWRVQRLIAHLKTQVARQAVFVALNKGFR